MKFQTEAEVGEVVKRYLVDMRQDVYCEVETGNGRIDIVAVSGNILTSVEIKRCLSMDVLGQAIHRSPYVHRSVAAFPMPKAKGYTPLVLDAVHEATGIGIWVVKEAFGGGACVNEWRAPRLLRRPDDRYVRAALCEEQKHQPAGVSRGYWSPFRGTRDALIDFVREHPGCTLKTAMAKIKHHYATHSSAYRSMGPLIRDGVIKEIKWRDNGLYVEGPETREEPEA